MFDAVRLGRFVWLCCCGIAIVSQIRGVNASESRPIEFNRDIRGLLTDRCLACHGNDPESLEAGLRLDDRQAAIDADAIVPGDALGSELIRRIDSIDSDEVMPPPHTHKPLSTDEKDLLRRWVDEGADYQRHWAYEPAKPSKHAALASSETLDRIIDADLIAHNIPPAPMADDDTLARRLSLDLTGLPPAPSGLNRLRRSRHPARWHQYIDGLIASPAFGERFAVYWLDLVRYADTVGYHGDQDVSQSPYRDYVIAAWNASKPYDEFVREQLAGDLIPEATTEQLVASGYNRLNQTTEEGGAQAKEYLAIYFADRVRNVSEVFLGSTMGCAQCHDHKYDPFTAEDFYAIGAFFADLDERGVYGARQRPPMMPVMDDDELAATHSIDNELIQIESDVAKLLEHEAATQTHLPGSPSLIELLNRREWLIRHRDAIAASALHTVVSRSVPPREIRVLPRGNWMDDSGPIVQPAIPRFLGQLNLSATDGSVRRADRRDLADWIADPDNPLTARAIVNRVWALLFGRGIVTSVNDFGGQGTFPSNPELLDALAIDFIQHDWDLKRLVRTIVCTRAYRRSSVADAKARAIDLSNDHFGRQGQFRISAEFIRDAALVASDSMVRQVGGRSVRPYQPTGYYAQLNFPRRTYEASPGADQNRRGLYSHWQRTFLHPMLKAFDAPSREECTASRSRSNTPLQALTLLNDPTFVEAARRLGEHVAQLDGPFDQRLDAIFQRCLGRDPNENERIVLTETWRDARHHWLADPKSAAALVGGNPATFPVDQDNLDERAAWVSVARTLLNLHETITRY